MSLEENDHDVVDGDALLAMDGAPHPSRSERRAVWEGEYGQLDWSKVPPHLQGYYSKMNGRYDDGGGGDGGLSSDVVANSKAEGQTTTLMSMTHLQEKGQQQITRGPLDGILPPALAKVPNLDVVSDVVEFKKQQQQQQQQQERE